MGMILSHFRRTDDFLSIKNNMQGLGMIPGCRSFTDQDNIPDLELYTYFILPFSNNCLL
jgi:hypothetical protein